MVGLSRLQQQSLPQLHRNVGDFDFPIIGGNKKCYFTKESSRLIENRVRPSDKFITSLEYCRIIHLKDISKLRKWRRFSPGACGGLVDVLGFSARQTQH
jgi:hypothetical protein